MGTVKVTFTLDQATVSRLQDASEQLALPKSAIVREAIQEFHDHLGRLTQRERRQMLQVFDEYLPRIPQRGAAAVDRELAELRQARASGGRRRAK